MNGRSIVPLQLNAAKLAWETFWLPCALAATTAVVNTASVSTIAFFI